MDEQDNNEYSEALDHMAPPQVGGPEEADDTGAAAMGTAEALGITEPPSQKSQLLLDHHPEIWPDYEEAVLEKLIIQESYPPTRGPTEIAIKDATHRMSPFLTLYERTKILSLRASQLSRGAPPFIETPEYLTDVYEIAKAELEAKRLPYILKRPRPNGDYEYWRLADLMIL